MDRKDSKKQRLSQRVKSVNHESVPVTPVLSEHNHNFDSDCSNMAQNFKKSFNKCQI